MSNQQRIWLLFGAVLLALTIFLSRNILGVTQPLDQLARRSLPPEIALKNGHPTVVEFYADWCEACQEMAPTMIALEKENTNQIDFVLINVDNEMWIDLLEKYEVNGIPQLNFFDSLGNQQGKLVGLRNYNELNDLTNILLKDEPLNNYIEQQNFNRNKLNSSIITQKKNKNNIGPMSHG